mmetsp:Transcript_2507/g.7489  ORF Transcript_2507/g.7489 Transcript_2507/m.7489 type:complete len:228 (-) Transcript_2507:239-922(-)
MRAWMTDVPISVQLPSRGHAQKASHRTPPGSELARRCVLGAIHEALPHDGRWLRVLCTRPLGRGHQLLRTLQGEGERGAQHVDREAAVEPQHVLQELQAEDGLVHLGHHFAHFAEEGPGVVHVAFKLTEVLVEARAVVDGVVPEVGGDARAVEVHDVAEAAHLAALHPRGHAEGGRGGLAQPLGNGECHRGEAPLHRAAQQRVRGEVGAQRHKQVSTLLVRARTRQS